MNPSINLFRSELLQILCFFCCFIIGQTAFSQKFIQMEKRGSLKVKRYYIGDVLIFKLAEDDKYWYKEEIIDILPDDNLVLFEHRAVALQDITTIRSHSNKSWSKGLSNKLFLFSGLWTVYNLAATLFGDQITTGVIIIAVVPVVIGLLIRNIFRQRTFKLGKKRWLRLMNLTMDPIIPIIQT